MLGCPFSSQTACFERRSWQCFPIDKHTMHCLASGLGPNVSTSHDFRHTWCMQWRERVQSNRALNLGGLRDRVARLAAELDDLRQSFLQLHASWEVRITESSAFRPTRSSLCILAVAICPSCPKFESNYIAGAEFEEPSLDVLQRGQQACRREGPAAIPATSGALPGSSAPEDHTAAQHHPPPVPGSGNQSSGMTIVARWKVWTGKVEILR